MALLRTTSPHKGRDVLVEPFWYVEGELSARAACTLREIAPFYAADPARLRALHELCVSSTGPTLRRYNWAVTNFARDATQPVTHALVESGARVSFVNLAASYDQQLAYYKSKLFSAFRRTAFRVFYADGDATRETRVCQLVFFKWCTENRVDEVVRLHDAQIRRHEADAMASARARKSSAPVNARGKATRLHRLVVGPRRTVFGACRALTLVTDTSREIEATSSARRASAARAKVLTK